MAGKQTTIHDIARILGVSSSTVSRALQDNPLVNSETRDRIKALAEKMQYHPNVLAHSLRKGKSKTVGVLVPRIDNYFFSSVISGIEKVLNESGYNVLILQALDVLEKEEMNVLSLMEHRIAGVLASPMAINAVHSHFDKLVERDIPLIFFDNTHFEMPVSMVLIDDYAGARYATEHLISQGCRRIIFLGGPRDTYIYKRRFEGYSDTLKSHGIPLEESLIYQLESSFITGQEVALQVTENELLPDGVLSVTDHQAIQFMQVLKKKGIKVPQQVAVAGFSNAEFVGLIDPPLTTIDQHGQEMGETAANMLLEEFELRKNNMFVPRKIYLSPELVIRQSSLRNEE